MNNTTIIKKIGFLTLLLSFSLSVNAQWKKEKAEQATIEWRYDIECEGIAKQGSKLVKVWSYSKNPKHSINQAMKNAVHGIIYKGYSGGGRGCTSFKPLLRNPKLEKEHQDFFDVFFGEGGEFRKYVTSATDGNIAPGDRLKVGKRMYKIGVIVNVATDLLRKRLEKEGVVKSLNSGF